MSLLRSARHSSVRSWLGTMAMSAILASLVPAAGFAQVQVQDIPAEALAPFRNQVRGCIIGLRPTAPVVVQLYVQIGFGSDGKPVREQIKIVRANIEGPPLDKLQLALRTRIMTCAGDGLNLPLQMRGQANKIVVVFAMTPRNQSAGGSPPAPSREVAP